MKWDHEVNVLETHGLTYGDWAILITAGYYIPVAGERFIKQALWEIQGNATLEEVRAGFEHCLAQRWVQLVSEGHIEYDLNVFGEKSGHATEYPEDGVSLTQSGHALWSTVAIAIFGAEYFRRVRNPQQFDEE